MDNTLPALLASLTASLESATQSLPAETSILSPKDGISLLDVKTELFLSYVQNLVFLIIVKLRHASAPGDAEDKKKKFSLLHEEVVRKLVELRVYLEKGVRPLEGRLKYQIDKVVRAAEDADRAAKAEATKSGGSHKNATNGNGTKQDAGYDEDDDEEFSDGSKDIDDLSYRPNISAMIQPAAKSSKRMDEEDKPDGIYRPPHITPTVMPVTRGREERGERRATKSAALDEFIATEFSNAPIAEPSIGSTIISGGRRNKTQRERDDESERRAYEEAHFIRLPKESKKERAKKGDRARHGGFGGEEWRNLDMGLDRIERLTQKKSGSSGGLSKSRKRAVEDGPRDSGELAGTRFAKKLRNVRRRLK